jgi:hypothetical protein
MSSGKTRGALIDRGANGGVVGSDVWIINRSDRCVDITGIDDQELTGIPIGTTAGTVVQSQRGPVIAILHQYALHGHGKSIHSTGQLEHFKMDVNDCSLKRLGDDIDTIYLGKLIL